MLFNSVEFLLFLPVVILFYYALPFRFRWVFLLGASYYFYMCWHPVYVCLLLSSTLVDYAAAIAIFRSSSATRKKILLAISLCFNLGLLVTFKYLGFLGDTLKHLFEPLNLLQSLPEFRFLLPIGISFYTFQTIGYTIDVYRGARQPERHFGYFALFVSFFPQLVAGPIERSSSLLPQFRRQAYFDSQGVISGLRLILWGFFKKVVIADRLAYFVNLCFNSPQFSYGFANVVAVYFFAFQIYCDFSGYTDIARGSARLMGINLMANFNRPYAAKSIPEFWKRWHISLSSWFRDFLYIPLGGSRVNWVRWYFNIFTVFILSGLWHGASWNFAAWGLLHGIFYMYAKRKREFKEPLPSTTTKHAFKEMLNILVTFHMVLIAWVFFRAESLPKAFLIFQNMFFINYAQVHAYMAGREFRYSLTALFILIGVEFMHSRRSIVSRLYDCPLVLRWSVYFALLWGIIIFGYYEEVPFIYFAF